MFNTPDGRQIARHVGRDTVTRVIDGHFAGGIDRFRADDQQATAKADRDGRLRRFTSNPLRGRPLVTGFGPGYLRPVPYLALGKATPWGVYFTGPSRYGEGFARDLGHLYEQYIGRPATAAAWCPGARRGHLESYQAASGVACRDPLSPDLWAVARSHTSVESWVPNSGDLGRSDLTVRELRDRHAEWTRHLIECSANAITQ